HNVESPGFNIKNNGMGVLNRRDGATVSRLGRDMTGHEAMSRSGKPSVGNKRDGITQTGAHKRRGDTQHLAHPGPTLRPFVANDNHVVGLDFPFLHGLTRVFLTVEHAARGFVDHSFMSRNFNHTTSRGWITRENRQPPAAVLRVRQWPRELAHV